MMISWCQEGNKGETVTCFGINGGQGVETVTNNVYRFVALITSFSAVTVNIIVDAYLFSSDIQANQWAYAITRQFRRINSMQNTVTKKPGLEKMMKNVHQEIHLLNKGE